VSNIFLIFS